MAISEDVWDKYDSINNVQSISPMLILFIVVGVILLLIVLLVMRHLKNSKMTPEDRLLTADFIEEMPLDTFLDLTDDQYKQANDIGVYILYNVDKEKYYIGKAPLCADAVNRDLIGKGSPDVFYEKKNGDDFTVQFYFVADGSAYKGFNELYHDAFLVYSENSEVTCL